MKKKMTTIALACMLFGASAAQAIPLLQLDISDGVYDSVTETIVSASDEFTLYALLTPGNHGDVAALLDDTYYISAAITPQVGEPGADLGSFSFNGDTVNATGDMTYGTPPSELVDNNVDLPSHGIFPTYFSEFSFQFLEGQVTETYNAQDNPGGWTGIGDGTYYVAFDVDKTLLDPRFQVHFDLYSKNDDNTINKFAPFSHDAQSSPVPEPATMLLFGTGLAGLVGTRVRRKKKA
jgi:hypothetical protein